MVNVLLRTGFATKQLPTIMANLIMVNFSFKFVLQFVVI